MKVAAHITIGILFKFLVFRLTRDPIYLALYAVGFAVILVSSVMNIEDITSISSWIAVVLASFLVTLLSILIVTLLKFILDILPSDRRGLIGNHYFEFYEEHTTEKTSYNESKISWLAVRSVSKWRSYIVINLTLLSCYFIPKSAFATAEEFELSWREIQRLWRRHHRRD
jgi:YcxB-like protein